MPTGKAALGGYDLGELTCVWLGLVWARYLLPCPRSAAAPAVPGDAPRARAGPVPRAGSVPGAVAWLAGAAIAAPCGLSGGVSAAPPGGGAAGAAACAAGAASLAGTSSGTRGSGSLGAASGCSAGGLAGTAASASRRSSRSAGVAPAHPGETGERKRDRQLWRSSRWGEPAESDIGAILMGVRGCRRACPTTSQCISGVLWAVLCGAGGGFGLVWVKACAGRPGPWSALAFVPTRLG